MESRRQRQIYVARDTVYTSRMHPPLGVHTKDFRGRQHQSGVGKTATALPEPERVVVTMRFDSDLLARVDAAARRQGISRTAWLHVAASKALER